METAVEMPLLEDLGEGRYRISLHAIQQPGSVVKTKDFLLPMLKDPQYKEFEILCHHVPSWLVIEIMDCRLPGEIEKLADGSMRVKIWRTGGCGPALVKKP